MNALHTPGPWRADGAEVWGTHAMRFNLTTGGTPMIARVCKHEDAERPFPYEENARRIVACVNACEGISTDRLEDLGRPLMNHLIGCDERAARMVKERDELLAALRQCREMVGHPDNVALVDAAIAKAEVAMP